MTRKTNARIAGSAYLLYIVFGLASMVLFGRATDAQGVAAKLARIAEHAVDVRAGVMLSLLCAFAALVLGVSLHAMTRDEDPDLAMLGLGCRLVEAVTGALALRRWMALLGLATTAGAGAPDAATANTLGAFHLMGQGPAIGSPFFAVGSTAFCWLLLRGRMIPLPLAWLGVVASVLVVLGVPLELAGLVHGFRGLAGWLVWIPMAVFEVAVAVWFLVKGVAPPAHRRPS